MQVPSGAAALGVEAFDEFPSASCDKQTKERRLCGLTPTDTHSVDRQMYAWMDRWMTERQWPEHSTPIYWCRHQHESCTYCSTCLHCAYSYFTHLYSMLIIKRAIYLKIFSVLPCFCLCSYFSPACYKKCLLIDNRFGNMGNIIYSDRMLKYGRELLHMHFVYVKY